MDETERTGETRRDRAAHLAGHRWKKGQCGNPGAREIIERLDGPAGPRPEDQAPRRWLKVVLEKGHEDEEPEPPAPALPPGSGGGTP